MAAQSQHGSALSFKLEEAQVKFDLSIALSLSTWPALTLAVQNHWGGPDSSEKREWFAGAISDLFAGPNATDVDREYLEEFMLQVMNDEFEVNVEDGSAEEVAETIIQLRNEISRGEYACVDQMKLKWDESQKAGAEKVRFVQAQDDSEDTDTDSEEDEEEDSDQMDTSNDIPELVKAPVAKPAPEVDEDGFTKVVGRRRKP